MSDLLRRRWSRLASVVAVWLVGAIAVIPASAMAQRAVTGGTVREGTLSFDGHATLGDFTGTTTTVSGGLSGGELPAVRGWVEAPVKSLDTKNGKRDRDLNKSMESDQYPTLRFELNGTVPETEQGDSVPLSLRGTLSIHGVSREIHVPASIVFNSHSLHLRSDFPLNLKDYQIGGLTKMLGILKMYPDIQVHVDLVFELQEP